MRRVRCGAGVIVVEEQGTVYLIPRLEPPIRLNHSGSAMWRLLDDSGDIARISKKYAALSEIPQAQAQVETTAFIEYLIGAGLLEVVAE